MDAIFGRLCRLLETAGPGVIVQTHDYPDHDAVAAAFALSELLKTRALDSRICYRGAISSHSLKTMIAELGISLTKVEDMAPEEFRSRPCIVIDGNPENTNARPVTDKLFGVVDHHANAALPRCPFVDIRTGIGACASMAAGYWEEAGLSPGRNIATALLMGIEMDTDFITRRVSRDDIDAFHRLFTVGDWEYSVRVLKASLSTKDLSAFHRAVANSRIHGTLLFTLITVDTTQEVISILADFFLRFREVTVTAIVENQGDVHHVSVRSRDPAVSAAEIIKEALKGIGDGGGHDYMAGGLITTSIDLNEEELFRRFSLALDKSEQHR
ncbi:MAG: DHH family phosphoesterase [Treponema sp.]|jgi:nanoRNase/pAp phosphatase (c-di-AMP/oligoRNAs hydrolase)|nr:DHH family phosphoesterase [Treponema sp.]